MKLSINLFKNIPNLSPNYNTSQFDQPLKNEILRLLINALPFKIRTLGTFAKPPDRYQLAIQTRVLSSFRMFEKRGLRSLESAHLMNIYSTGAQRLAGHLYGIS